MIYILNTKEDVVGVLNNSAPFSCPYYSDSHIENLQTGVHSYQFSVPASHEMAGKILADGFIIIRDLDLKNQMFKIKTVEETADDDGYFKEVYCEHVAISELLVNIVRPAMLSSYTLENSMNYILQGTGYELGDVDFIESKDIEIESHATVLEILYLIMELYSAEVQFEVVFKNGIIKKRLVHIQQRRGTKTNKLFAYGKDLLEVKRTVDTEGLITALIGVGKSDSSGKLLTLTDLTYNASFHGNGNYTKDVAEDYISDDDALQNYSRNGKHIFGVHNDSNAENQIQLAHSTLKALKERSKPKTTYECSVATLERITGYSSEKVRVGDTVTIHDTTLKPELLIEARIIEVVRSYTDPENDKVVLGDYRQLKISDNANIKRLQNLIKQKEDLWNSVSYKVELTSTAGLIFKGASGTTTLIAEVFAGSINVTDDLDASNFTWYTDTSTIEGVKTLSVDSNDFTDNATFKCEVHIV